MNLSQYLGNYTEIANMTADFTPVCRSLCIYPKYNEWIVFNVVILLFIVLNHRFGFTEKFKMSDEYKKYFQVELINNQLIQILLSVNGFMWAIQFLIPGIVIMYGCPGVSIV